MTILPELWPFPRPRVLLTDLDDTLLDGGRLRASVVGALESLQDAGVSVVVVTGRPATWAHVMASQWPIFGALGENGCIAYRRIDRSLVVHDDASGPVRAERRARLESLRTAVRIAFPSLREASDAEGRLTDRTWDIGESLSLPRSEVDALAAFVRASGARVSTSSIHLHATFDMHDKATGSLAFLHRELGIDPGRALAEVPFVGDSGNDRPCFSAFERTVGVANIASHVAELARTPRFRTRAPRAEGFIELARALLARGKPPAHAG